MGLGDIFGFLRSVDRILSAEVKLQAALDRLEARISALESRTIRLENREELVMSEAKGAASAAAFAAASQFASASIADIASRLGRLEERSGPRRLDPPRQDPA